MRKSKQLAAKKRVKPHSAAERIALRKAKKNGPSALKRRAARVGLQPKQEA